MDIYIQNATKIKSEATCGNPKKSMGANAIKGSMGYKFKVVSKDYI
jgi:hypothetical protein